MDNLNENDIKTLLAVARPSHDRTEAKDLWLNLVKSFANYFDNKNDFCQNVGAHELIKQEKEYCQVYWSEFSKDYQHPKALAEYIFRNRKTTSGATSTGFLVCGSCAAEGRKYNDIWLWAKIENNK